MKRFAAASLLIAALGAGAAFAANITPTPIVGPTETGENSAGAQQVTDMARLKVGSCAVTAGGTGNQTVTCNGAAGAITLPSQTFAALSSTVITINNTKIQSGDMIQCTPDFHAAAAGSGLICSAQNNSGAGTIVITLVNPNATTATGAITALVYFIVNTQGNPN